MNKTQAINNFWNGFGLMAYDAGSVPDDAELPYITYTIGTDDFDSPVSLTANIWYRSKTWANITNKCEEISQKISRGGCMVRCDGGAIWINKGHPFSQRVADPDDSIRRIFINYEAEFIS